jgi:thiamine-phosphate pyrophosphorylase
MNENPCRLYLISPPAIDLPKFSEQLKNAFDGGDVGAFQLRLKSVSADEILKACEVLLPICREREIAFIMNDSPELARKSGADGVHLGQDDLNSLSYWERGGVSRGEGTMYNNKCPHPSPLPEGEVTSIALKNARKIIGKDAVIGVSCHDSRHLAMVAGEEGADYVAFGAFYPTKSKSPEALAKYGVPEPDILNWWQTYMVLPCVAIGGINPLNCLPLVRAGADFIAVITAVWEHLHSPKKAVEEFNKAIKDAGNL